MNSDMTIQTEVALQNIQPVFDLEYVQTSDFKNHILSRVFVSLDTKTYKQTNKQTKNTF